MYGLAKGMSLWLWAIVTSIHYSYLASYSPSSFLPTLPPSPFSLRPVSKKLKQEVSLLVVSSQVRATSLNLDFLSQSPSLSLHTFPSRKPFIRQGRKYQLQLTICIHFLAPRKNQPQLPLASSKNVKRNIISVSDFFKWICAYI